MSHSWPVILADYRPAIDAEVRSWSFGALKAVRRKGASNWEDRKGTLEDQSIFGPVRDFECPCGRYRGERHSGIICDRCGTKITTKDVRQRRFGHANLTVSVPHPMGGSLKELMVFPVLPAVYFESVAGGPLADAYDALVEANVRQERASMSAALARIIEILLPITVDAHKWHLQDALTLAHGLCLERREDASGGEDRCPVCGYPLEGLNVTRCPGCGRQLGG